MEQILVFPTPQENEQAIETLNEMEYTLRVSKQEQYQKLIQFINHINANLDTLPSISPILLKVLGATNMAKLSYIEQPMGEDEALMIYQDQNGNESNTRLNLVQLSILYEDLYIEYCKKFQK